MRQQPDEDDEAFLMRAEMVMEWEEKMVQDRARNLVAAAIKAFDKSDALPAGPETVKRMMGRSNGRTRRAILLARSQCREMQRASTGPDPVAEEAYQLLSQLAMAALRAKPGHS